MKRGMGALVTVVAVMLVIVSPLKAQFSPSRGRIAPATYGRTYGQSYSASPGYAGYGPAFFPAFGGFLPPFYASFASGPNYPYLPNYWWVSMYPIADPRQDGYNPSSGYPWDSVTALLLLTYPAKARVILNGTFIGTANYLGPIELPIGEHTLRVEASGYEPSETVLKVEQPSVQQIEIRLNPASPHPKPGPPS